MIKRKCPRCGQEVTLDEQRYHEGSTVIRQCPQCGSDVEFTIAATAVEPWVEELHRQEQELSALLAKRKQGVPTGSHTADGSGGIKSGGSNNGVDAKKKKRGWIIAGALACIAVGVVVGVFLMPKLQPQGQTDKGDVVVTETKANKSKYETITVGTASFRMVRVEGGTFTMGATSEQGDDAFDDEYPTHRVTLSSYWIGETEVTQLLWKEVMGDNPSYFKGNDLPVENVSYDDVQKFIQKMNQRTGRRFRLPTEAEWEYAARGGRNSRGYKYSGSNDINEVAWYGEDWTSGSTHPVKQKQPNELGLYDMSGNVYEWCNDWDGDYSSASQTDPRGPESGSDRVLCGGSWSLSARNCRSSCRYFITPGNRYVNYGFRLALSE